MVIRIVTDSTSDLPDSIIQEYGITVVPVYINMNGLSYLDGIEISHSKFYDNLPALRTPPTTSAPGIGRFVETYKRLIEDGVNEIVSIHAAGALSNIYNVAQMASEAMAPVKISVVDSESTSLALGFQAIIAAKAARAGKSLAEIVGMLANKIKHTYLFAALDTIEYLRRSGRASSIQAGLGSLLQIKPVISLHNGKLSIDNIRTSARSVEHMIAMVTDLSPLEYLAVAHTHAHQRAEELCRQVRHLLPKGEDPLITEATPALGTHVGPGAVGILCISK